MDGIISSRPLASLFTHRPPNQQATTRAELIPNQSATPSRFRQLSDLSYVFHMATAATSRPSGPVLTIPTYRSASPTRVKLASAGSGARSPGKSVSVSSPSAAAKSRRSCMCSPTNHPGSFRCSLHKDRKQEAPASHGHRHSKPVSPPSPVSAGGGACRQLDGAKRMGSALVRLSGAVESGTWARRALAPAPQSQHRRRAGGGSFRPRPSRLSAVSFAGDRAGDNQ